MSLHFYHTCNLFYVWAVHIRVINKLHFRYPQTICATHAEHSQGRWYGELGTIEILMKFANASSLKFIVTVDRLKRKVCMGAWLLEMTNSCKLMPSQRFIEIWWLCPIWVNLWLGVSVQPFNLSTANIFSSCLLENLEMQGVSVLKIKQPCTTLRV